MKYFIVLFLSIHSIAGFAQTYKELISQVKILTDKNDYVNALPLALQALPLVAAKHGNFSANYANCLGTIAICQIVTNNNIKEGLSNLEQCLDIFETNKKIKQSDETYRNLCIIAIIALGELGEYGKMKKINHKLIEHDANTHGYGSEQVVKDSEMFGTLMVKYDIERNDAIDILIPTLKKAQEKGYDWSFMRCSGSLGLLCKRLNKYERAARFDSMAIYMAKKNIKNTTVEKNYAHSLATYTDQLAQLYIVTKRYIDAEDLFKYCITLREKLEDKTNILNTKNNLAMCYMTQKKYTNAIPLFKEIVVSYNNIKFTDISLFDKDEKYIIMSNLGGAYYETQDYANAGPLFKDAYNYFENKFKDNALFQIEKEQRIDLNNLYNYHFINLLLLQKHKNIDTAYIAMCYNNTLHLKGVLLNNYIQTYNNIKNKGNIVLNMELEEWQKTERLLNKNREILNEDTKLKLETENAERFRKLKQATVDFNTSNAFWNTTYLDVQQKLKRNETAIEFVSFAKHGSKDTVYLAALLLLKTGAPLYIPLGTEAEINALLARKHEDNSEETAINAIYTTKKAALYTQIWEPIESVLKAKNIKDIYYAPSGALHNVAFEAVVADKVGYNLHRVSSTRQLVSRDDAAQAPTSIVAFGDIPYTLDDDEVHKLKAKNDSIKNQKNIAKRNSTLSYFPLLENTAQEIKALAAIVKQNKIPFEPKIQLNANETAFKNMSTTQANAKITSPTVVHIATHGFYLLQNTTQTDSTGAAQLAANADPLQRCGLAFAGANAYWSNPNIYVENAKSTESSDNGILTANEIAQCNLRETDLVVLSACESALGDVNGEGVFGLQRGFKQAGAKSILMTLWQVDDAATAEMMTAFYTEYLTNKQTKREALRRAQEKMKRSKDYHTPYFWAGFVLLD